MLCYRDYRFLTKIVRIKREVWNNQSRERISSILTCRETLKLISGKTFPAVIPRLLGELENSLQNLIWSWGVYFRTSQERRVGKYKYL